LPANGDTKGKVNSTDAKPADPKADAKTDDKKAAEKPDAKADEKNTDGKKVN